jgi:hypothetical protein
LISALLAALSSTEFLTCPNQDTVYGAGFYALDKQPAVVQVPNFGDRFYTHQMVDHRTDSFASIGKQYGTKAGFCLLVGPNWKGDVPKGINAVCQFADRSGCRLSPGLSGRHLGRQSGDSVALQPLRVFILSSWRF